MIQRVLHQNHLSSEAKEFITPSEAKANHKHLDNAAFNAALVWNPACGLLFPRIYVAFPDWTL